MWRIWTPYVTTDSNNSEQGGAIYTTMYRALEQCCDINTLSLYITSKETAQQFIEATLGPDVRCFYSTAIIITIFDKQYEN